MTDDDKALVERLFAMADEYDSGHHESWPTIDALEIAAHRIEALSAENERLREALRPFAKAGEIAGEPSPYGDWYAYRPAAGDEYAIFGQHLREARAALGESHD